MADNGSFFSLEVFPGGWFAPETQGQGWFDKEFLDPASGGPVDHAASGSTSLTFTVSGNATADKSASGSTGLTFTTSGTATADRPASGTTGITFAATGAATADRAASGSTSLTFTVTGNATHEGQQPTNASRGDDAASGRPRIFYIKRAKPLLVELAKPAPVKTKRKARAAEIEEVLKPVYRELIDMQLRVPIDAVESALDKFSQSQLGYASLVKQIEAWLAEAEQLKARRERHKRIAIAMLMAA